MLFELEIKTKPKEMEVHWSKDENGAFLRFKRKGGRTVLKLYADYADERSFKIAAKSLEFLFRGPPTNVVSTVNPEAANGE